MTDIPKYKEFMHPILVALDALGGSGAYGEIDERVIEAEGISSAQLEATYPTSGSAIVPDRLSWARSHLKLGGLVDNPSRGVWVLTEQGRSALGWDAASVEEYISKVKREEIARRKSLKAQADFQTESEVTSDDGPDDDWTDLLLSRMRAMNPSAFERLAQRILRESGFVKVEVTGKSGDGDIDGVGVLRMKLISFQVLFQCKRYSGSVGAGTVRDFRGAMQGRADKGLIITTGTFTPDARREATRDGAPAIDLIDGEALCQLLFDLRLGVAVTERIVHDVAIIDRFFDEM